MDPFEETDFGCITLQTKRRGTFQKKAYKRHQRKSPGKQVISLIYAVLSA